MKTKMVVVDDIKTKIYFIEGRWYLNPYLAISVVCDKTFKTEESAWKYVNETGEDVYWCKEV